VLAAAGYLALLRGQEATAQQLLDASLSASRELNDSAAEATALFFEALFHGGSRGDLEGARLRLEESLRLAHRAGPAWVRHLAPLRLADLALTSGDHLTAEVILEDGIARAVAIDNSWIKAKALRGLGYVRLRRDDLVEARRLFHESLVEAQRFGDVRGISQRLDGLACVAFSAGEAVRAARLFGAADGLRADLGTVPTGLFVGAPTFWADRLYSAPESRPQIEAAWAAGRALSLERAITEACESAAEHA
jgi:non-specific serine/threonine protein kinase